MRRFVRSRWPDARIYHGTRASPSSPWTWQRDLLDDNSHDTDPERDHGLAVFAAGYSYAAGLRPAPAYPALGVWGASSDDVYAWYANTIFRWKSDDGGARGWTAEYIVDDPEHPEDTFFVFAATGSSHDDVWFAVGRARFDDTGTFACPMVIHKTETGYRVVVDSLINDEDTYAHHAYVCQERPGSIRLAFQLSAPGWGVVSIARDQPGWITSIASAGPGATIGIVGAEAFTYVAAHDGGVAGVNGVNFITQSSDQYDRFNSVWFDGADAWVSGWGHVVRADGNVLGWSTGMGIWPEGVVPYEGSPFSLPFDAGTGAISPIGPRGMPIRTPLYQIRGSSNTNLWAVGAQYALHRAIGAQ